MIACHKEKPKAAVVTGLSVKYIRQRANCFPMDDVSLLKSLLKVAEECTGHEFEFYNDGDGIGIDAMFDYVQGKVYIDVTVSKENIAICCDYTNGTKADSLVDCQDRIMRMLEEPVDCSFVSNEGTLVFDGPTVFFGRELFEKDPENLAYILPSLAKGIGAIARAADRIFLG